MQKDFYFLYRFDCELKIIFLKRLLRIENKIKTAIAYNFSKKYANGNNAKNCIIIENFDLIHLRKYETNEDRYCTVMNMITKIQTDIAKQIKSNNSIRHYIFDYGYVPLWVLMNVLPFGSVSLFYRYMKQEDKQQIAKVYKITDTDLEIILKILSIVRNLCAHDERLYNFKPTNYIKTNWVHSKLQVPIGPTGPVDGRQDLFAVLICIRLFVNKVEMKKMVAEIAKEIKSLDKELKVININDVLKEMGFPNYWKSISTI